MKTNRNLVVRGSSKSVLVLILLGVSLSVSYSLEFDGVGRVVRGQLESLYSLRNKLGGASTSAAGNPTTSAGKSSPASSVRKESRGYSFHYSPAEVSLPSYASSFSSRVGKLEDAEHNIKVSVPSKKVGKFKAAAAGQGHHEIKFAKKSYVKSSSSPSLNLNSFNVHHETKSSAAASQTASSTNVLPMVIPAPSTTVTSLTETGKPAGGLDIPSSLQTIGQGLNQAMTAVVTQKLMGMLDQDVPPGMLNPLRHLVASGNRMIEFWDKRASARDGKKPSVVEMLGYGLDQLKGFRDGQAIKPSDSVVNTSASQTLIQGLIAVKRLTNRVLGYDTSNEVEGRGGYGHDSYGHGGGYGQMGSSMYGGLDPFSLLAALAFGAFLLQLLLTLLNSSARSLNVVDLNTPLLMSDFHLPKILSAADKYFGTPTVRNKRALYESNGEEENMFYSIVDKLDGLYNTYKQVSEKPKCAKLHLCRLAIDEAYMDEPSMLSPVYIFGLGHLGKEDSASAYVKSIKKRVLNGEDIDCDKLVTNCTIPDAHL